MRIEVEKRKVVIVTLCDVCKGKLTDENVAHHAHEDRRHGVMTGLGLSIYISSNEFARSGGKVKGNLLDGDTDLCKKCHRDVIQWYLDHIEPGSGI